MIASKCQHELEKSRIVFPGDIEIRQTKIRDSFLDFFRARGYIQVEAESIVPKENDGLLFTNATIVPLKKFVEEENVPTPGLMVEQSCLRVQNLKHIFDDDFVPEYMSYFRMLGVLSSPVWYERLVEEVYVYLIDMLKIARDDIKILASSKDKHLLSGWYQICQDLIEKDTRNENFYIWTYGMEGVSGRGITFSIRQSGEEFEDIGNVIEMTKNGKVVGYEFGFGTETIIARLCKLDGPFEAARISQVIPFKRDGLVKKLQDCVVCTVVLYGQGIRPGSGKARFVTKKAVKGLIYLRKRLGIDLGQLKSFVRAFERIEFGQDTSIVGEVINDISKYEDMHRENLDLFERFVENQRRLMEKGQIDRDRVIDNLRKRGFARYHLSENEYQRIVDCWFPDL